MLWGVRYLQFHGVLAEFSQFGNGLGRSVRIQTGRSACVPAVLDAAVRDGKGIRSQLQTGCTTVYGPTAHSHIHIRVIVDCFFIGHNDHLTIDSH